jgi:flagellar assembly protein FliH
MLMKGTAKFLFDEDFATGEKPTITLVEHERRRADAESQAYRKGFAAGEAQAQQDAAQRIAAALAVISDGLARLDSALTSIETRLETEAVEVAVAVAEKLAPALIAREPLAEISALAAECFHRLRDGKGKNRGNRARARLRGTLGDDIRRNACARRLPG